MVDSLIVEWPYGEQTVLTKIPANQTIRLRESDAGIAKMVTKYKVQPVFSEMKVLTYEFAHKENYFIDFNKDQLIYNMYLP